MLKIYLFPTFTNSHNLFLRESYKLIFLMVAIAYCFAEEVEIENCSCWDQYKPTKLENGKMICSGIFVHALQPCNIPKAPRCECTQGVTAIHSDSTGTWCTIYSRGVEKKRWPCENEDEWKEFRKMFPFAETS